MKRYVIGVDQSTQGTKALLFDEKGVLTASSVLPHRQIVNEKGWVSHDPEQIYRNTVEAVRQVLAQNSVGGTQVAAIGLSNQRETTVIWERATGKPLANANVWQCGRAGKIVEELQRQGVGPAVKQASGLVLSAYFPAAKMAWFLREDETLRPQNILQRARQGEICLGTVDSWLLFRLTHGGTFATDYSNASRTQLFNLRTRTWDVNLCQIFGVPMVCLPEVLDSDACFGDTDMEGLFEKPVPIFSAIGDSHASLFAHGCRRPGMVKATYGTGSSVMLHAGEDPNFHNGNVVTSIAWGRGGKVSYVLEGNINYSAAVVTWLKDDVGLIASPEETEALAISANPADTTYLVPAFTGLGAPYWDERAKAALIGMSRTTGRAEIVRAGLECIAYQIHDVLTAMENQAGMEISELRVDGGACRNAFLTQFKSDIAAKPVRVSGQKELSGTGAAYLAGIAAGLYDEEALFAHLGGQVLLPHMEQAERQRRLAGWKQAVECVLTSHH